MPREINDREFLTQVISEREALAMLGPLQVARTAAQIDASKLRVRGWVLWWWSAHLAEAPSQVVLAEKLGITPPGLNQLLRPNREGRVKLGLDTLLAVRDLVDWPLDTILEKDPPPLVAPLPAPFAQAAPPPAAPPAPASSSPARPRRRRAGGGR